MIRFHVFAPLCVILLACEQRLPAPVGAASCQHAVLDDLEDGDGKTIPVDQRGGEWITYKDEAGSTLSPDGKFAPTSGGAKESKHAAHISGKTTANGIAFAGMGFGLVAPVAPYDVSKAAGLCFFAKGKGPVRVKLPDVNTFPEGGVCKSCYNDFGADLQLSGEWKEHCFDFKALRQQWVGGEAAPAPALERVYSVQWQVNAPGAEYDVWVDEVRLTCAG